MAPSTPTLEDGESQIIAEDCSTDSTDSDFDGLFSQNTMHNGCATTASAIAQRLSQPKWGKAVPGTQDVLEREQCYYLCAAPNKPVAHLGQPQSRARQGERYHKDQTSYSQVVLANPFHIN
ncbi:hypothetical protein V501_01854 [Pseudogymnoascus sp. VKM F-4519 (FW-2642)]|nr:hypothetical protein V501_01854 [Pseudogymnoascus sp. VKM F-4519 (FW-2642)]